MSGIAKMILSLSFSGSLLILLFLFCKPLIQNRFSKRWQYLIWLIVIARLLLPVAPEMSPVETLFSSVGSGMNQISAAYLSGEEGVAGLQSENAPRSGDGQLFQQPETDERDSPEELAPWAGIWEKLCFIWLTAALLLLVRKGTIYQSFVRFIKAGRKEVSDVRLLDTLAQIGLQAGVKRPVELYTNPLISSPLLLGFFRPCIVLPTAGLPDLDFQYIILHELTHYKRRDMFYKWLVQLTVCLHWFNPLVYLMEREIGRACELACDEAVIRKLDDRGRRAYGDTLVNACGTGGGYKGSVASVTFNESKELLKERLGSIMNYKKMSKAAFCISGALVFTIISGAFFLGAYAESLGSPDRQVSQQKTPSWSAPDHILVKSAKTEAFQLDEKPDLEISIGENASVEFVPTEEEQISIDYGDTLYDVAIESKDGVWKISIEYIGPYSKYPGAVLHIPNVPYSTVNLKGEDATVSFNGAFQTVKSINTDMKNSCIFYTVPKGFAGTLNAFAPNSYFELLAEDSFKNCDVSISNAASYGEIADGFQKQGEDLVYINGTKKGVVKIDLDDGGYVSISDKLPE